MADLLIVGSVAYDSVETDHGRVDHALGGAASYAAVAAAYFAPARIVAVVGEDFEAAHLDFFRARGIDLEGLQQVPGKTFHWAGRYATDMNQRTTLVTELNVFEQFEPTLPASYRQSEYVLLANIHPSLQLRVLDQMTAPKFVGLDSMNLWIDIARAELLEVIGRVDLMLLNDEEATLLTGERNPLLAARRLLDLGPRAIVVKKGEHGALLVTAGGVFVVPAYPVTQVIDPTGCGDCFAGGLLGWLAAAADDDPETLRRAMVAGTIVASFNVEAFSLDRLRELSRADLEARWLEFAELCRFAGP